MTLAAERGGVEVAPGTGRSAGSSPAVRTRWTGTAPGVGGRVVEQVLLRQDRLARARAADEQRDAVQRQPAAQHGVQASGAAGQSVGHRRGALSTQVGAGARAGHAPWRRTAADPAAFAGRRPRRLPTQHPRSRARRPRGSASRRALARCGTRPDQRRRRSSGRSTSRSGGSSARICPASAASSTTAHAVALGAQEVVRELRSVGIALGEQDRVRRMLTRCGPRPVQDLVACSRSRGRSASKRCASAGCRPASVCSRTKRSCSTWSRL